MNFDAPYAQVVAVKLRYKLNCTKADRKQSRRPKAKQRAPASIKTNKKRPVQPETSKAVRKSARREIQLDTETSYKTTQNQKRKEPSSPQAKRMLGRQKMLNRNAEMRELKDKIILPKTSRGHIRAYSENCLVLVCAFGCRLKVLEKGEPISTTQLADEVSAALRLANRNGQVTCAYELIKRLDANKDFLQTAPDRLRSRKGSTACR